MQGFPVSLIGQKLLGLSDVIRVGIESACAAFDKEKEEEGSKLDSSLAGKLSTPLPSSFLDCVDILEYLSRMKVQFWMTNIELVADTVAKAALQQFKRHRSSIKVSLID